MMLLNRDFFGKIVIILLRILVMFVFFGDFGWGDLEVILFDLVFCDEFFLDLLWLIEIEMYDVESFVSNDDWMFWLCVEMISFKY